MVLLSLANLSAPNVSTLHPLVLSFISSRATFSIHSGSIKQCLNAADCMFFKQSFFVKIYFTYWKEKDGNGAEREKDIFHPLVHFWIATGARVLAFSGSLSWMQGRKCLDHLLLFSQSLSRELDRKLDSWDQNQCPIYDACPTRGSFFCCNQAAAPLSNFL